MALIGEFSKWLATTPLSHAIQEARWLIPALQTIHILGVAVAFSSAVLVNLRILRVFERDEPLGAVAQRFLPWIWPALIVLVVTGSLLIVAEPRRSLMNSTFYFKMALLVIAIPLTGLELSFAAAPAFAETQSCEIDRRWRMAGVALAALSILVWCGILFAGRWIAYTQV
jgi:uncharacterized membrane protein